MPLQIGSSALWSLLRASALLVPGVLLTGAAIWLVAELGLDGDFAMFIIALPAMVFFFAVKHLRRALEQRPSDLEFDGSGFSVRGGRHGGLRLDWSMVKGCTLEEPEEKKKRKGKKSKDDDVNELWRLQLVAQGEQPLVLAATEDEVERASLEDVAQALDSAAKARATPPPPGEAPPDVVRCGSCRAPVSPSAEASAACAFCGAAVAMPGALREKLRAAQVVAKRPAKAVERLLRQPRAGFVGSLYAVASIFMLTAWPVALVVLVRNAMNHTLDWLGGGFLVLFLVACLLGFFGFIRGLLVDRQALRLVVLRFTARAPLEKGKPHTCRQCEAPLPEAKSGTLVTCAYCEAPNLLSTDFSGLAREVEQEQQSLERALARRLAERRLWRGAALAGVVLIAVSGWALRHGVTRPPAASTAQP